MAVFNHGHVRLPHSDNDLVTEAAAPASSETFIPILGYRSGNLGGTYDVRSSHTRNVVCLSK